MTERLAWRRHLVLFVKAPLVGQVKSRLAADIGWTRATHWYRTNCRKVITSLSRDPRWQTYMAVAPDALATRLGFADAIPPGVPRLPQGEGELDARMSRFVRIMPPGPVVIVGTDIPDVKPHHIWDAFKKLGSHDAVFGRATDGGYWLVGFKRVKPILYPFENVRWSTEHALDDTLRNLHGREVGFVSTLNDVDEERDLAQAQIE